MPRPTQFTTAQADRLDRESPRFFGAGGAPKLGTLLKQIVDSQVSDKTTLDAVDEQTSGGFSLAVTQAFSGQPSHLDTDTIGGDTYQFLTGRVGTSSTSVSGYIGVLIGADLDSTMANLVAAINHTAHKYHKTLLDKSGGAAAGWGGEAITASYSTGTMTVFESTEAGSGKPSGGSSIALSKSGSKIGDWSYANLDLIGASSRPTRRVTGSITVDAAWVTAAAASSLSIPVAVGFEVGVVLFDVVDSSGTPKPRGNDSVAPDASNTISLTLNSDGTSGPDLVADDVVHFVAFGS